MSRIYYYNPTFEMAIAHGHHSYQPPDRLKQFEVDLGEILLFLATGNDIVINQHSTNEQFVDFWRQVNKSMPHFLKLEQIKDIVHKERYVPTPWGISKQAFHLFNSKGFSFQKATVEGNDWNPELRQFFSRETSAIFEKKWLSGTIPDFCQLKHIPQIICSQTELCTFLKNKELSLVIKSLWSSSGRGIFVVKDAWHINPAITWASGRLRHDKGVIIEKWMHKVADFSFQFHLGADNTITFLGINYFSTDTEGRFDKEWIHQPEIFELIKREKQLPADWEEQCVIHLTKTLQSMQWHTKYVGIIGMDAMVIKEDDGKLRVRCCVEINFRYNMGLVNMALKSHISESAKGHWQITQFEPHQWIDFYHQQSQEYPAIIENNKLRSGFFPLVSPLQERIYAAWGVLQ